MEMMGADICKECLAVGSYAQVKWSKHSKAEIAVCSVRVEGSVTHRNADRGDNGREVCVCNIVCTRLSWGGKMFRLL